MTTSLRSSAGFALIATLLVSMSACGGGGSASTAAPTPTPTQSSVIPYSAAIKVAFVGASITLGATGTNPVWSAQTVGWLKQQYKSVEVQDFSLSYTTSQFAAYRMEEDLRGFVPDLVFVEYAVNDLLLDENGRTRYTDALFYKLRRANPKVVIVYVATANALEAASRGAGQTPPPVTQIKKVADRDGVHFIDAGAALWSRVLARSESILTYLPDGVHPAQAASDIYFTAVRDSLVTYLPQAAAGATTTSYIGQSRLQDARVLPATNAVATGCAIRDLRTSNTYWRFEKSLTCAGGNQFTLDFTGTSIGFVYGADAKSGAMTCSIDGSASQQIVLFDSEPPLSGLFLYANLLTGLSNANHKLSCQVNTAPPIVDGVQSTGTNIAIAGFMTSAEQSVTP